MNKKIQYKLISIKDAKLTLLSSNLVINELVYMDLLLWTKVITYNWLLVKYSIINWIPVFVKFSCPHSYPNIADKEF